MIYLISKISIKTNCSDVRWKAIPQICSTVAEATFQKIGMGLRQSQFVIGNEPAERRREAGEAAAL